MQDIDPLDLNIRAVHLWMKQWLLLTAGDRDDYNTMTVAWGSIGCMWGKPFVQVVVRPVRHTYNFTEKYPTFTVTAFPEEWRPALKLLGTKSGRDGDKIAESGLTVAPSKVVDAPAFAEAELILECRKIYWQDMAPDQFLDDDIHNRYPQKDYHRIYYGEIVRCAVGDARE